MNYWPTLDAARSFLATGRGRGIKIAVLDSGIDPTHPLLAGLVLEDDLAVVDAGSRLSVEPGTGVDV